MDSHTTLHAHPDAMMGHAVKRHIHDPAWLSEPGWKRYLKRFSSKKRRQHTKVVVDEEM